jgi:hypothetical protein
VGISSEKGKFSGYRSCIATANRYQPMQ